MKKALKVSGIILGAVLLAVALLLAVLTATEYRPEALQPAERIDLAEESAPAPKTLTISTWNMGYGGLGKDSDFFMDGGKMVHPPDQQTVDQNLAAITAYMAENPADIWFIQELDVNSARSGGIDQFDLLQSSLGHSGAFTYNYKCDFVPFPLPPIGKIESGLATFTGPEMKSDAQRVALTCPFKWPIRTANLKRCLLVTRNPVEGTDKELVLVNLHLEAYSDGDARLKQTEELLSLMEEEYKKGNYVIAGGDFNQSLPGGLEAYPINNSELWTPGVLEEDMLPEGWHFAADSSEASCRLLNAPYSEVCPLYVIDGFIISPNIELVSAETVGLDFENSDHNPVRMQVTLH